MKGFNIVRKLDNGEIQHLAWRANLEQAENLVRDLREHWPAEYFIEEGDPSRITSEALLHEKPAAR
jgi:hypothetical protein